MTEWLECVPNFSEGRDPEVLEALVHAATSVPGVQLLGHEMDADHHRAVLTLAGEAAAMENAAFVLAKEALGRIDLREHEGVHRRTGSMDVCPFVPLGNTAMARAVQAAESVGERIADELGVPVYLYGGAARRPERRVLGYVRNRGFEALRAADAAEAMEALRPDFAPRRLDGVAHPTAGATFLGARSFLIAYNVNLATDDLALAQHIARKVRASSGGLPSVQAMGFFLKGPRLAQVSTNILDFQVTSVRTLFDRIAALAAARGVAVHASELIGFAPAVALEGEWPAGEGADADRLEPMRALANHLKLPADDIPARVIEHRLRRPGS